MRAAQDREAIRFARHEEEIYEVERELRELDLDAPDYDERHAALRAERARLGALPAVPDKIDRRKTGDTIAQYWATLPGEADKRAFLLKHGVVVRVRRGKTRDEDHVVLELHSDGPLRSPGTAGRRARETSPVF